MWWLELRVGMEHKVKEIREEAEKYAVNTIEELDQVIDVLKEFIKD